MFLLLLAWPALAAAALLPPRAGTAPSPWVTIDASGTVATVTPTVSGKSTVSPPPSSLTQTAAYELIVSGTKTTTTATPAVATAAASGTAGAFVVCNNYQGVLSPFCQPSQGSELPPGNSYFVTWDPSFFYAGATVQVAVLYDDGEGFLSSSLAASRGFYTWNAASNFLTTQNAASVNTSLYLVYAKDETDTNTTVRAQGPSVLITRDGSSLTTVASHRHHVSAVAVAVPVVLGLAAAIFLGFCIWSWRRHGHIPFFGSRGDNSSRHRTASFGLGGSAGYGVRQSYAQRTGDAHVSAATSVPAPVHAGKSEAPAGGIQLTDRDSWSPTRGGANVFREELRRQAGQ